VQEALAVVGNAIRIERLIAVVEMRGRFDLAILAGRL
jgi:hypothetical protein